MAETAPTVVRTYKISEECALFVDTVHLLYGIPKANIASSGIMVIRVMYRILPPELRDDLTEALRTGDLTDVLKTLI